MKRGFVWISAVLYIALGVIAISLVLSAGLPLINKMKDRNTILQTKDVLYTIDKHIEQVSSEGIGSKRVLDPVIIKGGKLMIFNDSYTGSDGINKLYGKNKIIWEMKTNAKVMEACEPAANDKLKCTQLEGNLKIYSHYTKVEGEYLINIVLDYDNKITLSTAGEYTTGSALVGKYALSVKNIGSGDIEIEVK